MSLIEKKTFRNDMDKEKIFNLNVFWGDKVWQRDSIGQLKMFPVR
jgi:hypothetical protein|tara:strand:+ start:959 stop:1093 length:135 start_codon:yes stop_codon:yes gene_type:complete